MRPETHPRHHASSTRRVIFLFEATIRPRSPRACAMNCKHSLLSPFLQHCCSLVIFTISLSLNISFSLPSFVKFISTVSRSFIPSFHFLSDSLGLKYSLPSQLLQYPSLDHPVRNLRMLSCPRSTFHQAISPTHPPDPRSTPSRPCIPASASPATHSSTPLPGRFPSVGVSLTWRWPCLDRGLTSELSLDTRASRDEARYLRWRASGPHFGRQASACGARCAWRFRGTNSMSRTCRWT